MSLHKGYFEICPDCKKKGVYVDADTGRARCKYCGLITDWKYIYEYKKTK